MATQIQKQVESRLGVTLLLFHKRLPRPPTGKEISSTDMHGRAHRSRRPLLALILVMRMLFEMYRHFFQSIKWSYRMFHADADHGLMLVPQRKMLCAAS